VFFGSTNKPLASIFDGKGVPTLLSWSPEVKGKGLVALQHVLFLDYTILGWAIQSQNVQVITYLLRVGIHPESMVDKSGNNALQYSSFLGCLKVVDTVLNAHDEMLILEKENNDGMTAAMLAAKSGNFIITRKLLRCGCNPRKALAGKYWGWLLAMVRQKERYQIDTQTGIYGDDDKKYFSLHPDPTDIMWG
jgi:ankyrin repeat protein